MMNLPSFPMCIRERRQPLTRRREQRREKGGVKILLLSVLGVVAAAAGGVALLAGGEDKVSDTAALYPVSKVDLVISVTEGATLQAAEPFEVKSEVEGQTTIVAIAEEGGYVQEGDLLVELDVSTLKDDQNRQQIRTNEAQLNYDNAVLQLDLQESENESALMRAQLAVDLAKMDLEKYQVADFDQAMRKIKAEISLAESELSRAKDQWEGTKRLEEKGYVSGLELKADELSVQRRELDLELARNQQSVLEEWDKKREELVLENDLAQALKELERVKTQNKGELDKAQNNVQNKKQILDTEQEHLDKISRQIEKARVVSDRAGLVVYATISQAGRRGGEDRPIEVGASVREQQLILSVTESNRMVAEAKVHESQVDKVKPGQRVHLTVDALPGVSFWGRVKKVAILPDSQNMWLNPELKVYNTTINIETNGTELRPGMSCTAEIRCSEVKGVLAVPLQAILMEGRHHFCFVRTEGGTVIREVEIGQDNDRLVEVKSGLAEGELVYLARPVGAPEPDFPDVKKDGSGNEVEEAPADDLAQEGALAPTPPREQAGEASPPGPGLEGRFPASMDQFPESMREEFRKRWESLSEEERKAMMERFGQGGFGKGPRRGDRGQRSGDGATRNGANREGSDREGGNRDGGGQGPDRRGGERGGGRDGEAGGTGRDGYDRAAGGQ
ncbi:MAG: HlyD family efflux transporter periplasmic adaptor subunit [Planctomycetota bacterium]